MVTYDAVELGRSAAELLFERIRGGTHPIRQQLLTTNLVLRGGRRTPRRS
jgi:DNA-binding LacI/PurR family transcriptional regulator